MTETKFTPGPWSWMGDSLWGAETGRTHAGETCLEAGHCPSECGPSVLAICSRELAEDVVNEDCPEWTVSKHDASLIAAAPDLYEALVPLLMRWADPLSIQEHHWNAARDALKKARGET